MQPAIAVEGRAPVTTPWRVLMIGDEPGRLVESNIILNLNPPSKIADTSWIRAGKSAWDWWSGEAAPSVSFKTGMNTATMKHYIDFASASGFPYMLIDAGWAKADRKGPQDYSALADITQIAPEIDMPELLRYAKEKHVGIWLWSHWTSVDKYMDQAFPLFEKWGIAGVKIDFMDRDDQQMVNWYRRVCGVGRAASPDDRLPRRIQARWPAPHLSQPDYSRRRHGQGVFEVERAHYRRRTIRHWPLRACLPARWTTRPAHSATAIAKSSCARKLMPMGLGTRAHELALYVVLESPLQMVSDYPEHYAGQHDFEFIKQVPATWDEVRVLDGRPMENITVARRSGKDWYIGSITNWDARTVKVPLSFLGEGKVCRGDLRRCAGCSGRRDSHRLLKTAG